jgi:hypothetical protein
MKINALSSQIWFKSKTGKSKSLSANRPATYIFFVLIVVLASYAYVLRSRSIFACQADGYSADRYVAYCNGESYGEYEHGAFAFGLEPSAEKFAGDADVLFLGSSRIQVALSTTQTAEWFSAALAHYYLLGFSYSENVIFAEMILPIIHPRANVYVINVDDFFERFETAPVSTIFHDPDARNRYQTKRLWQRVHEPICNAVAILCRSKFVIFRSRRTGAYREEGGPQPTIAPVSYNEVVDQDAVNRYTAAAVDFLTRFTRGKCVILTMVPTVGTKIGNANAVAAALGMKLVTPPILEGLQTYDGSHLDQPSAKRWSQAFFQTAGPKIKSCLKEARPAPP